ncbi:hypothetical protein GQ54DRAFT_38342 [Martensiomyces pterosporus]|nr:hypothetical protein GQ54DRAFT_38342 [Martensiomyces pterosporus]
MPANHVGQEAGEGRDAGKGRPESKPSVEVCPLCSFSLVCFPPYTACRQPFYCPLLPLLVIHTTVRSIPFSLFFSPIGSVLFVSFCPKEGDFWWISGAQKRTHIRLMIRRKEITKSTFLFLLGYSARSPYKSTCLRIPAIHSSSSSQRALWTGDCQLPQLHSELSAAP